MKNNVLSAFVVFFAVLACLLIIDDLSHSNGISQQDNLEVQNQINNSGNENLATLDLDTED
ncbi:MAG: hypothetical protein ED556_01580 [Winogradskyella sp.]|uniref:hypothetical protein n=1 Tax=Winogradskyella sp. TaxID=1883156 RepID=UPI000F4046CE|nr:hypothetical protein [Winogradskyella sp.]RNC87907.1 MAG: hypothetical protein ED556_01580 [Winogradskyella sp.]